MKVTDVMAGDVTQVGPETSVREARRLLADRGIRHLPVVATDGELLGMLSDRDVRLDEERLREVARSGRLQEFLDAERPVEAVMSSPPHTLGEDATVQDAARLMLSRRVSAVPIVSEDRVLLGMITTTDCLLALLSLADPEHEPA